MNLPLALTVSRFVFAIVVGVLLWMQQAMPFHIVLAAALFITAATTDYIDGELARRRNQKTPLGAFLDPLADTLLVYLAFINLTILGVYPAWLLLVLFARDIVTDALRSFAAGQGTSIPANLASKGKTTLQMASIALMLTLGAITEVQGTTAWGETALAPLIESPLFDAAFGLTYWLMVLSAAIGIVGTAQYMSQYRFVFSGGTPPSAGAHS